MLNVVLGIYQPLMALVDLKGHQFIVQNICLVELHPWSKFQLHRSTGCDTYLAQKSVYCDVKKGTILLLKCLFSVCGLKKCSTISANLVVLEDANDLRGRRFIRQNMPPVELDPWSKFQLRLSSGRDAYRAQTYVHTYFLFYIYR